MGFLAPGMLLGALAVAIPIALHFFFRNRYQTVPWAAMKFLLASIEETSRRLRFQELLLLVCRCVLLALLALALARPLSSVVRGAGQGDAVDAVFVLDTSFSMGASDGSMDRLGRARQAALKIIDQLPAHSTIQIVTCADRADLLGPRAPADLDQARELVQNLSLTSLATDFYPGLTLATDVLGHGQASNKELYLFSDMQKSGWERQFGNLQQALQDLKKKATIFMVRCGTRQTNNVAIVGINSQSGVPRPGERIGFAVLVKNTGKEPVTNLKLSLTVDGNDKTADTQALPRIDPGETRAVTMTAKLEKSGLRTLTARLAHDDLEGDNRFDQVILVRQQISILVIDGGAQDRDPEKWSSFHLMNALLPVKDTERAKYYLQPRLVTPRLAAPALLAKADLCILVNVALQADPKNSAEVLAADFVESLAGFVREGKGLLIYAGTNVKPSAYNLILGKQHGLLPAPIKGVMDFPIQAALKLDPGSAGIPALWKFRDDAYYKGFKDIEIYKALELTEPAPGDTQGPQSILFRYSNGKPAVVSRPVGGGEVVFISTSADKGSKRDSADPTWTDWPIHFEFVPFVDTLISHLLQGQTPSYNLVAGDRLDWHPTQKVQRAYTLVYPDGKNVRLGLPDMKNDRAVVTALDLSVAGIYSMVAAAPAQSSTGETEMPLDKTTSVPIAVVPDLRESQDLSLLTDAEIDQKLGFAPVHMTAGGDGPTQALDERLGHEWTIGLLAAVLLLAIGETLLAYWCDRAV